MSVEIEPSELGFKRPFTVEVAQVLKIKNPTSGPVAFKVKTTAPKQYCVRPNSGRIEPRHDVEVCVLLQAMKQEPAPDAKCRDKFLVQAVMIPADQEFTNVADIWDGVRKEEINEKKIRVSWLPAGPTATEEAMNHAVTPARKSLSNGIEATPEGPPPSYSSPNETYVHTNDAAPAPSETREDSDPAESVVGSTVAAVQSVAETGIEEVKAQLAAAQATIASLRDEAAGGLRKRKMDPSATLEMMKVPSQDVAQAVRQGTQGVPVRVVALLCLVSFPVAYFFF